MASISLTGRAQPTWLDGHMARIQVMSLGLACGAGRDTGEDPPGSLVGLIVDELGRNRCKLAESVVVLTGSDRH